MNEILNSYLGSIIIAVIGIVFFVWTYIRANRAVGAANERFIKEMAESPDIYDGPAGEPIWNEKLPERVDDYTVPRYVYANHQESTEYDAGNGRIVGYRISPTLVIHSRVKENVSASTLPQYIERYGGALLNEDEVKLFKLRQPEISALREKAKDTPLEVETCWYTLRGVPVVAVFSDVVYSGDERHLLVLKRV